MKKRLLPLMMSLVICLGLTVPATAADNSSRNWWDVFTYENMKVGNSVTHDIQRTFTRILPDGSTQELNRCSVFSKDYSWKITSNPENECTLDLMIYPYVFDADKNAYVSDGHSYQWRTVNRFVESTAEVNETNGEVVTLKAGESLTYTLNDFIDNQVNGGEIKDGVYYYVVNVRYHFPNEEDTDGVTFGFMLDESATAALFKPSAPAFTDVAANSPFAEGIGWAVDQNITNGITPTTFGPSNTCTVSHILTFLWRSAGQPGDSAAAWAGGLGIDTSNMSAPCTRAAAVTYMWKAAGSPTSSKSASFTDVASNASYAQAVSWAVEKGITSGTSATTFAPDNTCTRGQIVTFLYRASK